MNGRRSRPALATKQLPAGQVEVTATHGPWLLIAIGRAKSTRRFNLTRAEAAELVRALKNLGPPAEQSSRPVPEVLRGVTRPDGAR